ncbi:ABC transporter permease/substrate-binding protein [Stakelama saccharophila]|uniref:ABC transporter permease/substrate-binding protein n=1 Tax=Stakelama saccharophila TaxID=3075605 RepID=A0ABZ0BB54_9SPHN|nr:ABC transporter permease/substrate-binding protein [Stakelama sp. W311]WNO54507.1 ABC transporter permease/substrate-binding protein [Stakelama sp. W311]
MNEAFARVPDLLAQHVLLSAAALMLGLAISLPLAIWSARSENVARVTLGFASLVQTIPALALLALFYPILLFLSRGLGGGIPALGFLPSLLALGLYALLPILRNGVTGLVNLDPAVLQAADGVGMTGRQKLWLVEAPLVAPVLMAGIRTAAVWTIGAATLSTTVGQPSLGDLIFAGLQTQNWTLVVVGCIASAGLALVVDALLGLAERGIRDRRKRQVYASLIALALGVVVALWPVLPSGGKRVVIGAKGFSEQYILARVIGDRLEAAGYDVVYRQGLGSAVVFSALATGDIDVYVDYSGTLWTNRMHREDVPPRKAIVAGVADWAKRKHGVGVLGALGFENAYGFAMREEHAKRLGIESLSDLAPVANRLAFGTDLEFLERPEWAAVQRAYSLEFASAQPYNPTFMYRAVASGKADVIAAFTSDGRIAAQHLRVLSDPRHAIPGYDAILLVAPERVDDAKFVNALTPMVGAIPVDVMRRANYMVDRPEGGASPAEAARWLERQTGLTPDE